MTRLRELLDDRYRLDELIRHGGMSDVYRAVDERTGATVAVKVVRSGDQALALRMAREAATLESLDHPNLVRLLDTGTVDDQAYLVMDFVDGPTLAELAGKGPLSPAVTARVGREVATALAYIHARGIVHRDVKPANVIIESGGVENGIERAGAARLADFGIAQLADASTLTLDGTTLGTVAYMAPEQLEHHAVGPAADIWSLGIVLLECLTGKRAYQGTPSEVIARRLSGPPEVPEQIPTLWRNALGPLLEHDPARRPSASQVTQRLSSPDLAADNPWGLPAGSEAVAPTQVYAADPTAVIEPAPLDAGPVREPRRRHAGLIALILALVAAGAIAFALSTRPGNHPSAATTTVPRTTPPTTAAPTPTQALSALTSDVNSAISNGTLTAPTGQKILQSSEKALADASSGATSQAAQDLQQTATTIASGRSDGTISPQTATTLQSALSTLALRLGLPGAATAVTPQTTPPTPAPPHHHGKAGGGGDGGKS